MLFLGSLQEPALAKHIVPYTDTQMLARITRAYVSAAGSEPKERPYPVWRLRDAALLAMAKSGAPEAVTILEQAYKNGDIRARFISAMALFALGSDTGSEMVEAYRAQRERENPELEARWFVDFAGGDVSRVAIRYLDSPKLDRVFLDRIEIGFTREDGFLPREPAFFARHRAEVLSLLSRHIEDRDRDIRREVVDILRFNTGQTFGFDPSVARAEQQAAIDRWKEYVAIRLNESA